MGVTLADLLGMPFADTDAEVEASSQTTIPELFAQGESVFREIESTVIGALIQVPASVIATGGGSVLSQDNVELMKRSGSIVHLSVDVPTADKRLEGDGMQTRPLLSSSTTSQLLEQRQALYLEVSDVTIATVDKDPGTIAQEVATWLDM